MSNFNLLAIGEDFLRIECDVNDEFPVCRGCGYCGRVHLGHKNRPLLLRSKSEPGVFYSFSMWGGMTKERGHEVLYMIPGQGVE
jgi:hypothetical protein